MSDDPRPVHTRPIPIEDVARFPRPGTAAPVGFRFRPDSSLLCYLGSPGGGLAQRLEAVDVESGDRIVLAEPPGGTEEKELSLEEQLRRERLRQRAVGITSYAWSRDGARALVPYAGGVWVLDEPGSPLREVVPAADHPAIDATFSRDGRHIAYVREAEVYVVPVEGGSPVQITRGARGTGRTHGLAEYVAQEEMARYRGFWWSPDGAYVAFQEADETHIPVYRIVHQGKDAVGDGAQEDHRYPFAGEPNARVRLGVVPVDGSGEAVWMDLGPDEDVYLARVAWFPDGSLAVQMLNREQTELRLLRCDPATGSATELLRETSDVWVNLHACFRPLENGESEEEGGFLWASERSGYRHLEVRGRDGALRRVLTEGDWMVDGLSGLDEDGGIVYLAGTRDDPRERHLYAVPLAGGDVRRITEEAGTHMTMLDGGHRWFVDRHHALDRPPVVDVRRLGDGATVRTLHDADDPRIEQLGLAPPQLVSIRSRDGATLHGALYRPPEGEGPWPLVVSVYGGPHAQRVVNGWDMTVDMRAQALRRQGYAVFVLDNRGSARRGLEFEGAIRWNMGDLEVRDQVDGVRWLVDQGVADPARVAIYGWSYGGYMSLMCLARAPDVFHAAVSGAPVTHWDGYDTCYTERYMGTPQSNPDGYERSAVMAHVDGMRGRLMLVHGLIDENVHFRHTARLVNALIKARKPYELLLFPDERHMPRGEADRVFMEERIQGFLDDALSPR
jgi:dipeptidyl-peptidase-4